MTQPTPHFKIRIPLDMKDQLERSAKEKGRSLTAEILFRLQQTLTIDGLLDSDESLETVVTDLKDTRHKLDDTVRRLDQVEKRNDAYADMAKWVKDMTAKVEQIERNHAARVAAKKK